MANRYRDADNKRFSGAPDPATEAQAKSFGARTRQRTENLRSPTYPPADPALDAQAKGFASRGRQRVEALRNPKPLPSTPSADADVKAFVSKQYPGRPTGPGLRGVRKPQETARQRRLRKGFEARTQSAGQSGQLKEIDVELKALNDLKAKLGEGFSEANQNRLTELEAKRVGLQNSPDVPSGAEQLAAERNRPNTVRGRVEGVVNQAKDEMAFRTDQMRNQAPGLKAKFDQGVSDLNEYGQRMYDSAKGAVNEYGWRADANGNTVGKQAAEDLKGVAQDLGDKAKAAAGAAREKVGFSGTAELGDVPGDVPDELPQKKTFGKKIGDAADNVKAKAGGFRERRQRRKATREELNDKKAYSLDDLKEAKAVAGDNLTRPQRKDLNRSIRKRINTRIGKVGGAGLALAGLVDTAGQVGRNISELGVGEGLAKSGADVVTGAVDTTKGAADTLTNMDGWGSVRHGLQATGESILGMLSSAGKTIASVPAWMNDPKNRSYAEVYDAMQARPDSLGLDKIVADSSALREAELAQAKGVTPAGGPQDPQDPQAPQAPQAPVTTQQMQVNSRGGNSVLPTNGVNANPGDTVVGPDGTPLGVATQQTIQTNDGMTDDVGTTGFMRGQTQVGVDGNGNPILGGVRYDDGNGNGNSMTSNTPAAAGGGSVTYTSGIPPERIQAMNALSEQMRQTRLAREGGGSRSTPSSGGTGTGTGAGQQLGFAQRLALRNANVGNSAPYRNMTKAERADFRKMKESENARSLAVVGLDATGAPMNTSGSGTVANTLAAARLAQNDAQNAFKNNLEMQKFLQGANKEQMDQVGSIRKALVSENPEERDLAVAELVSAVNDPNHFLYDTANQYVNKLVSDGVSAERGLLDWLASWTTYGTNAPDFANSPNPDLLNRAKFDKNFFFGKQVDLGGGFGDHMYFGNGPSANLIRERIQRNYQ